jgi:UDP-N-acetylglucosamine--N-acetylmuramyl-(pentapeptide) pyrophosphoryl-undecaprenol N-acetylglucosamine transferase
VGPGDRLLLIFGGSQAVARFNAAVSAAIGRLVERVHVLHVTGDAGYAAALHDREALPEALRARYRPYPFLRDEMTPALAAADLAVGRAGASTLAEAAAFGLPMAVVPYPHAAGHQRANALAYVEAGCGILIEDEDFDAERLLDVAGLLAEPREHASMAASARAIARPRAADAVAELIVALAAGRPLPEPAAIDRLARGLDA